VDVFRIVAGGELRRNYASDAPMCWMLKAQSVESCSGKPVLVPGELAIKFVDYARPAEIQNFVERLGLHITYKPGDDVSHTSYGLRVPPLERIFSTTPVVERVTRHEAHTASVDTARPIIRQERQLASTAAFSLDRHNTN
jgi:hypothetical protein